MNNITEFNKGNRRITQIFILLLLLFSGTNYFLNGFYEGLRYQGGDFLNYYVNAKLISAGVNIHDDAIREAAVEKIRSQSRGMTAKKHHQPDYPPFWYLLIVPLTVVRWEIAFAFWVLVNQVFLLGSVYFLFRYFGIRFHSMAGAAAIFIMLNQWPLWYNMMEGQVNVLLLFLITGGLWAFKNDKDWLAGLMFGLAAGIKIVPGFLLFYFLWRGHWKVVIWGAAGLIGTLIVSAIGAGPGITISYFLTQLPKYGGVPRPENFNQSINGFVSRIFTVSDVSEGWFNNPALGKLLCTIIVLAVFAATLYFVRGRIRRCHDDWDLGFGIFIISMLMMSSWTLEHHFVLLYFVWLWIMRSLFKEERLSRSAIITLLAAFVIIAFNLPYQTAKFDSGVFILIKSLKFYAICAVWYVLMKEYIARSKEWA